MRKILILLFLIGIMGCSSLPKEQQQIIDKNNLKMMSQDIFDDVYYSTNYSQISCKGIILDEVNSSLDPYYVTWPDSTWPKKDRLELLKKWTSQFEKEFKAYKGKYETKSELTAENKVCGNLSVKIYDIEFGTENISISYRNNTGFDLPLKIARLEVLIRTVDKKDIIGIIMDEVNIYRNLGGRIKFEIDPQETKEIIANWTENIFNILGKIQDGSLDYGANKNIKNDA